ncbi:hypothetical protein HUS70_03210 [Pandoraea nosoerga]|uniref:Uncharacterized protein n=1 Tax=Pandoraea nosoerga TaxID=2508296 RepID=A0A5E4T938_9BURK|nr:hypothetical protein [Pandoraea nosoerga]MBN4664221.1 hypothetical protein [Pandoraea nosoerga]MBN4675370.1 hypothetical protein [Pandoraea nosoerga]MBN4679309.1 hypothetical protein [Pandoraea nosoerga]MBN4743694.1 hypothetical protein [Pandoraea nosoerga]VVD84001.1 hypothetical protein PNO31109_01252 [Pandoraea nosoerga]
MFALYPILVLASLLMTLLAWALAPALAAVADDSGNLPRGLRWFQTFDATLDAGWQDGYLDASWGTTPLRRFLARVWWLYRNPAYGWDYGPFGVPFKAADWRVLRYVERPDLVLFIAIGRGGAFNVYCHARWGMAKLGWKAWNRWDGRDWGAPAWAGYERIPLCFTVNPFKRRTLAAAADQ